MSITIFSSKIKHFVGKIFCILISVDELLRRLEFRVCLGVEGGIYDKGLRVTYHGGKLTATKLQEKNKKNNADRTVRARVSTTAEAHTF